MLQFIIETLADTLSGFFAEKYAGRAMGRLPARTRGWISLAVLVLLIAFFIGVGIWIIHAGEALWVAILMFLFALMVLSITVLSIIKGRRK